MTHDGGNTYDREDMMEHREQSKTARGLEFEVYVRSLYEALGFVVEHNVRLNGQQIDLIARKSIAGVGPVAIVIECKFLSKGRLSNQEVHNFITSFHSLRAKLGFSMGVIVCNSGFTAEAKSAVHDEPFVQLRRLVDLEHELFDVSDNLLTKVLEYERQDLFYQFVPLSGLGKLPGHVPASQISDVLSCLFQWVESADGGLVTLLGDFGSGKTTILQRLEYLMARTCVRSEEASRIPILFSLRDRGLYKSLEEFVRETLVNQFQLRIPLDVFWRQLRYGRIAILLDGFDEIATHVTSRQRANIFHDLAPLLNTKSPAVLTCRPAYFVSSDEYNTLIHQIEKHIDEITGQEWIVVKASDRMIRKYVERPILTRRTSNDSGTISINTLDKKQIDEYLKNRSHEFESANHVGWEVVRDFLYRVYDLKDLMSRPILLSMISDTVIEGRISLNDHTIIAGPAGLYQMYTDLQLQRDAFKGESRRFLTVRQRKYFAQAMALAMLKEQRLEVSYQDIIGVIADGMDPRSKTSPLPSGAGPEQIATDVTVCAFLTRQDNDLFRFVHKSFMEFFIAQYIIETINEAIPSSNLSISIRALNRKIPNETLSFLANFSRLDPSFHYKFQSLAARIDKSASTDRAALENINRVELYNSSDLSEFHFEYGSFNDMSILGNTWDRHQFSKCEFTGTSIDGVVTKSVIFSECSFLNCRLDNVKFYAGNIQSVFRGCRIENSHFEELNGNISFRAVSVIKTLFMNTKIKLEGEVQFHSNQFNNCNIRYHGDVDIQFFGCQAHALHLIPNGRPKNITIKMINCDLRDSFIIGAHIEYNGDLSLANGRNMRNFLVSRNIRGLLHIIASDSSDRQERSGDTSIEILSPQLVLVTHGNTSLSLLQLGGALQNEKMIFSDEAEQSVWNRFIKMSHTNLARDTSGSSRIRQDYHG